MSELQTKLAELSDALINEFNDMALSVQPRDVVEVMTEAFTPYQILEGVRDLVIEWAGNCQNVGAEEAKDHWLELGRKLTEIVG
jgi:hypothetical protein